MFAQGFDYVSEPIKEYPNSSHKTLRDQDLTLKNYEDACRIPLLDAAKPDFGLSRKV